MNLWLSKEDHGASEITREQFETALALLLPLYRESARLPQCAVGPTSTCTTAIPRSGARRSRRCAWNATPPRSKSSTCEGILAFAERLLPRAADLWVQATLEQRQRFQQLFFPDGIAFDGKGFVGTRVTAPAFSYLRTIGNGNERLVDQTVASWNRIREWLRRVAAFRILA